MLIVLLILIVLSSFIVSSSYHNNNNTTIVLLTVIDEKRNSSEYGSFKADILKYLSIQNRIRYCIKHDDITCVIGIGAPRRGRKKRLFKRSRVRKDKYLILSSRYLKVSWILHLLNSDIQKIMYLDEDAFITKSFNAQSVFDSLKSTTCLGLTPDITYNRYNTGVMFIKNCQSTFKLFNKVMEIHQIASEIENHSDQLVLNRLIDNSNYDIQNISRTVYNSHPIMDEPYWGLLGLTQGDENVKSSIIHFAGIYGGERVEHGGNDPVIALLTMKAAIIRHKRTYQQSIIESNIYCADSKESVMILNNILRSLNTCISYVFGLLDNTKAELTATECLHNATSSSMKLLKPHAHQELLVNGLLIT